MTVQAYLFQSPYPQPFQVGRPDPSQKSETAEVQNEPSQNAASIQKPGTAQIAPTSGNGFSIDMGSLQKIGSQSGVNDVQAMNRLLEAQKAYTQL